MNNTQQVNVIIINMNNTQQVNVIIINMNTPHHVNVIIINMNNTQQVNVIIINMNNTQQVNVIIINMNNTQQVNVIIVNRSLLGQITKILLLLCYAAITWHQTTELSDRNGATEQCLWRNQHSSKFPLDGPGPGCEHNSVLDKELITISRSVEQINWWLGCCCRCFSNWGLVAVFVFLGQSCRSFSLFAFFCNFPSLLVPLLFHP